MSVPLLRLNNITKSFGAVRALKGVSFDLFAGEVHALVGENGAGKSTLIKTITGAHQPDSGTLDIAGARMSRLTPASAHASGIAAIYQQPALFPDLSVEENIALALEKPGPFRRVNWRERRNRAGALLDRIGAQILPDTLVNQLSMPQQQMLEIARALGTGARILLMDEPTASLTSREVELLFDVVRGLRTQQVGVIYISHRLEEVFEVADRVTVLRDGETVGTRPVPGRGKDAAAQNPASYDERPLTQAELITMMVGREVSTIFPPSENAPGKPALRLQQLGCSVSALHDINLEVRAGEIVGLAGLVGAGRTELARVLFGITPADAGQIQLAGSSFTIKSPQDALLAGLAYVPEDRRRHGVILEMAIAANITLAVLPRLFPRVWMNFARERSVARQFLRELAIKAPSVETRAAELSGGNQQKVALARWLAAAPKVLILDEPTQGVDIGAKAEIHKLIRQLAAQGVAVLMISSELPEILGMSDRIAVMRQGTIAGVWERNAVDAHAVMAAALGQKTGENPKSE